MIVKLIAKYRKITNSLRQAVTQALKELKGSFAIAVIDSRTPGIIVGACSGSPLVIGIGKEGNFIASDIVAFSGQADKCIYLNDGDVCEIFQNKVSIFDQQGWEVKRPTENLNESVVNVSNGAFSTFMLKEIYEQPKALFDTFVLNKELHISDQVLKSIKQIHIAACGTSYHAGMIAKYFLEKIANISTFVEIASEYRCRHVVVPDDLLFISISQSGETADTIAALKKAKSLGYAYTLTVCNCRNSTLVRNSDFALLTRAGIEIGVASTKAFTTQLLTLK